MRILIAGMGDLGGEVARLAVHGGHEVLGLRRSKTAAPPGVAALRGDVTTPGSLDHLPPTEATIYCVAAAARDEAAYQRTYPEGLSHLLDALERTGSAGTRVLFVSSTGVYGDAGGDWVNEDTVPAPASFTGRAMLDAEHLLEARGFEGTSLRLGGIYGPGRTSLIDAVRAGQPFPEATMRHWTNRVHRDDAARAIMKLVTEPLAAPTVNVVDPHPARREEVLGWLAARVGVDIRTAARTPGRRSRGDRRVSSQRLASTDFEFLYPSFKEGYGRLLDRPS